MDGANVVMQDAIDPRAPYIPGATAPALYPGREVRVRRRTGHGFSPEQTKQFWNEVLEPVTREHVLPNRDRADLIITLSSQQMPVQARLLRGPRSQGA